MKCPKCGSEKYFTEISEKCTDHYWCYDCNKREDMRTIVDRQQSQIEELKRELAATKLKWQTGKPPKTGYYWIQGLNSYPTWLNPTWWDEHDYRQVIKATWAGPIEPPA